MLFRIQVKDASVETQQLNGPRGPFETRSQYGWVDLPNGETRKLRIRLGRSDHPYGVGFYTLSPESFVVDQYGVLALKNLVLVPSVSSK